MEERHFGLKVLTKEKRTPVQNRKWPVSMRVWTPSRRHVEPCESGWHLADPSENGVDGWVHAEGRLYLAEGRGTRVHSFDKAAYSSIRLLRFLGTAKATRATNGGDFVGYTWTVTGVPEFEGKTALAALKAAKSMELNGRSTRGVRNRSVRPATDLPNRKRLAVRVKR